MDSAYIFCWEAAQTINYGHICKHVDFFTLLFSFSFFKHKLVHSNGKRKRLIKFEDRLSYVARGFHLFNSENYFDWSGKNQQKANAEQFAGVMKQFVRTFYTEYTVFSNQNHFRIYKHVSEGRYIVLKNFSCSENFQFWKSCNFYQELDRNLTKQTTEVKVNILCLFALWVRFFLPTYVHTDQGKTLLRRLCVQ